LRQAAGEDAAGARATVVRTSWVYAARGNNFVNTMLGLMRTRDELRVVCDQVGAPTWATSLARVLWALGTKRAQGVWHYADGGSASRHAFAVAIQEEALALGLLDRAVPVIPIATADHPAPAKRPAYSLLDCSATDAALATERLPWRTNLRTMLGQLE
jgi:dTDP-4-dehydrorhamnose reductase